MTICLAAVSAVTHEDHSQYQHCPVCTAFIQACSLLLYPLALLSITLYIYTHQNPVHKINDCISKMLIMINELQSMTWKGRFKILLYGIIIP